MKYEPIRYVDSKEKDVTAYKNGGYWTHGKCRACGVIQAWPSAAGKRLKDGPGCPSCGTALVRGSVGNERAPRVRIGEPVFTR